MNLDFNPTTIFTPDDTETARQLWHDGVLADAADLYDRIAHRQPRDPRFWLDAGRFAQELGRTAQAVERFQHAAAIPGLHQQQALLELARTLMHRRAFAQAGRVWWQIIRRAKTPSSDTIHAWAGLAVCAQRDNRLRLAQRCARRLKTLASPSQRRRAVALMWVHANAAEAQLHETPAATAAAPAASPLADLLRASARTLRRHALRHPDRADAHYHLAVCSHALSYNETARAALDRALRLNPAYAAAQSLSRRLAA